ncbi:LamG domain-containing protein [Aeromonas dhakensis]|uniref:LamG domain-containing protein n=1 Tax=Aeromonas dhakensis TaxID=196024 RepID=UPI0011781216|nr:LamG domain-containing protein [Aeromonas dhakensis]
MASDQVLRDMILASNPVGYYPLDTLTNLGRDISPYANNGSQSGTFRQLLTQLADIDIALAQGAVAALVTIPDRPEYKGRTFTMECIIAQTEDANLVIAERGSDNQNWSLQSAGSSFSMPVSSYQFVLGPSTIPANGRAGPTIFAHLIFTSVNGLTKIYQNGVALIEASAATGSGIQGNQGTLPINLFSRNGNYGSSAGIAHVAFYNRELTAAERQARADMFNKPYEVKLQKMTTIPANQEARSQFQPQDIAWIGDPPMYSGPNPALKLIPATLCKGRDQCWTRDGVQNVLQGYIRSTVTINGEGVRRRVLCFTQDGYLVGETYSRASDGVYQFDLLWLNRRYMVVAQDDPAFGPADYNAVAADYQAPTPYPANGSVVPFFQ